MGNTKIKNSGRNDVGICNNYILATAILEAWNSLVPIQTIAEKFNFPISSVLDAMNELRNKGRRVLSVHDRDMLIKDKEAEVLELQRQKHEMKIAHIKCLLLNKKITRKKAAMKLGLSVRDMLIDFKLPLPRLIRYPIHGYWNEKELDEIDKQILDLVRNGSNIQEIAKILEVKISTVGKHVKKMRCHGINIPKPVRKKRECCEYRFSERDANIERQYQGGLRIDEIAFRHKVTYTRILQILHNRNVSIIRDRVPRRRKSMTVPNEKVGEIIQCWNKGLTIRQIVIETRMSLHMVKKVLHPERLRGENIIDLKKHDEKRKMNFWESKRSIAERLCRDWQNGEKISVLAKKVGLSKNQAYIYIRKHKQLTLGEK